MNMNRILIFVVLFFSGQLMYAQQDQKAKEILDKVTETSKASKSIEAVFSFSMENKEQNISEKHSGSIVLKGNKYKVKLSEMGLEVFSDGKDVWTYMSEANEVNVSPIDSEQEDNFMDPTKVFTIYQTGFNYKFIGEENKNGKSIYTIDLIPQSENNNYNRITVCVDKAKMMIYSAKMQGKDGNLYTVVLDQLKTDNAFNDSCFVFDSKKHPNVEIIDMR